MVSIEASHLSCIIREGVLSSFGIPASVRFDRIEVSNILDVNYLGTQVVLTHWGPLLKDTRTAALVGYFMNWTMVQPDGSVLNAGRSVAKELVSDFIKKGRVRIYRELLHILLTEADMVSFQALKLTVVFQIHVCVCPTSNIESYGHCHHRGPAARIFPGSG